MDRKIRTLRYFGRSFPVSRWHWTGEDIALTCPSCGGEARFFPATLRSIPPAGLDATRSLRCIDLFEVEEPHRKGIRTHYGAFFHRMGDTPPEGWELPDRWAAFVGTLACLSCNLRRKHVLDWPTEAHFQLDFDGQRLWFYNRDHIAALIALLEAKNPRALPRFYWFNNILPSHFKTEKARKALPTRLRKLISEMARP
jgi:hypothetical protein